MYIEDIELPKTSSDESNVEENAKIEGTGSGFVWDKLGHIVRTNEKKPSSQVSGSESWLFVEQL